MNNPEGSAVLKEMKQELMDPSAKGMGLANVIGLSDEEIRSSYAVACQKLTQNDVVGAAKLFVMLVALKHNEPKHWRGLGICAMRAKQFAPANLCFTRALVYKPDDIVSLVFRGEARLNIGQQLLGREDLNKAAAMAQNAKDRESQNYGKRAKNVLKLLDSNDAGGSFER